MFTKRKLIQQVGILKNGPNEAHEQQNLDGKSLKDYLEEVDHEPDIVAKSEWLRETCV